MSGSENTAEFLSNLKLPLVTAGEPVEGKAGLVFEHLRSLGAGHFPATCLEIGGGQKKMGQNNLQSSDNISPLLSDAFFQSIGQMKG